MTAADKPPTQQPAKKRDSRAKGVRKPYARRACLPCKKAHAACDNNRPCRRCVSQGIENMCVNAERKKSATPRKPRRRSSATTAVATTTTSRNGSTATPESSNTAPEYESLITASDENRTKRRKSTNSTNDSSGIRGTSRGGGLEESVGNTASASSSSFGNSLHHVHENPDVLRLTLPQELPEVDVLMLPQTSMEEVEAAFDQLHHASSFSSTATEAPLDQLSSNFDSGSTRPPRVWKTLRRQSIDGTRGMGAVQRSLNTTAPIVLESGSSVQPLGMHSSSLDSGMDTAYGTGLSQDGQQWQSGNVTLHSRNHHQHQHHHHSSSTKVPSDIEKLRNTITTNMLPYLIKGLADAANVTTDSHRLQQIRQHQNQLIQILPYMANNAEFNITPEQIDVSVRQLQSDIAYGRTGIVQPAANLDHANALASNFDDINDMWSKYGNLQQYLDHSSIVDDLAAQPAAHHATQIQDLTNLETDTLGDPFSTYILSDDADNDMDMDLLDAQTDSLRRSQKDRIGSFTDLSSMWSSNTPFAQSQPQKLHSAIPFSNSLQAKDLYGAEKPSSPLTLSSLLNPDMFDTQRDISTMSSSPSTTTKRSKDTNARIQELMNQLLKLNTRDSPQTRSDQSVAARYNDNTTAVGSTTGDDGNYIIAEPRSPEHRCTVTFTDLDNIEDSTECTILDLATQSASELQDKIVTDNDILSILDEVDFQQQSQGDGLMMEVSDGNNESHVDQSRCHALVNYVGNSGKSDANAAIGGDMRMRTLDQQSGIQAIRQLLSKKKLSVKDILRQLLIQNRDMHMIKTAQEEDRKKIENQREEINSLKKKQDDMMSIILDLQKLMISSGFIS